MNEQNVLRVLGALGVVLTDSHFVLKSGKHASAYVNKDALYPDALATSHLCGAIAERFVDDRIEVVVGPAIGGIILSHSVAYHLSSWNGQVLGVFAEKEVVAIRDAQEKGRKFFMETGEFVFNRGYQKHVRGKRVLVVEDVLTTGLSVKKVVEAVRFVGGEVVGVCALCNRGGVTAEDVGDVPKLTALVNITLDAWDGTDCPLCKQGVPINTEVGKGKEFLARKKA